jgi:hypothetical protein
MEMGKAKEGVAAVAEVAARGFPLCPADISPAPAGERGTG